MTMAVSQLYIDDICCRIGEKDLADHEICTVERTHVDIQGHSPRPEEHYDKPIRRHYMIPREEFLEFIGHGRPPSGTVLVVWNSNEVPELLPTSELELYHRFITLGDTVKKITRGPMGGVVIGKEVFYDLQPLRATTIPGIRVPHRAPKLMHIPYEELKLSEDFIHGDWIIYRDWFGSITENWDEAAIYVHDSTDTVFWIDMDWLKLTDESQTYLSIGAEVCWPREKFPSDRLFERGSYRRDLACTGMIMEIKTYKIRVDWHTMRIGTNVDPMHWSEPPEIIKRDELRSGRVQLMNWTRTPSGSNPVRNHTEYRMFDIVRFQDREAAARKYINQRPTECRHIAPCVNNAIFVDPSRTLYHDMNMFRICGGSSKVTVRWEDLSVTTHCPIELFLDQDYESENDLFPGQLVIPNPQQDRPVGIHGYRALKLGVLQSTIAAERFGEVVWNTTPDLEYFQMQNDWVAKPVPRTGVPIIRPPHGSAVPENVCLWDIKVAPDLCRTLRDVVLIVNPMDSISSYPVNGPFNWIGQVVEMKLDGMLVIRTENAEGSVTDIEIKPEHAQLIIYGKEIEAAGSEISASDGIISIDGSEYEDEVDPLDVWAETEEGERTEMKPEEEADWATDDSDIDMADVDDTDEAEEDEDDEDQKLSESITLRKEIVQGKEIVQEIKDIETSVETKNTLTVPGSPELTAVKTPLMSPPSFDVLESIPPDNHGFITERVDLSPAQMRRVQKEHKSLFGNLPDGVYIRTWESRMDLFRLLLVGPTETPYEFAPFVIDLWLPPTFPHSPPKAHFHSWIYDGQGSINPNLYEDGKVCLSLLNTWQGEQRSESWSVRSSILQVAVSILGLVLNRQPYFNEAGYDVLVGSAESRHRSEAYSERTYFRSRKFIVHALVHGVSSMNDVVKWLYLSSAEGAPAYLTEAIKALEDILQWKGEGEEIKRGGLGRVGKGALIKFRTELENLKAVINIPQED